MKTKILIGLVTLGLQLLVQGAVAPLYQLGGVAGNEPYSELLITNDWIYGTTFSSGASNAGTVFKATTNGTTLTVLKTFSNTSGNSAPQPLGGLVMGGDTLYGTTSRGVGSGGSVFKINTDGSGYADLCAFDNGTFPGDTPQSGVLLIGDTLYGTTYYHSFNVGSGYVFKIGTNGLGFTLLHMFTNNPSRVGGENPSGGLATDGNFIYGVTFGGGAQFAGAIYKVGLGGGNFSVIHDFAGTTQGASPAWGVIHAAGTLYGVAGGGVLLPGIGAGRGGIVYKVNTDGSGYTILHSFTNTPDGKSPVGKLLLVGNTLYGVTTQGGAYGVDANSGGTLFKVDITGSGYAVVNSFTNGGGAPTYYGPRQPFTGVTLNGGRIFGTTRYGGTNDNSTIYALTIPSGPPSPPLLQIVSSGNQPIVFWVDDGIGWNLQQNTDLLTTNWSNVGLNWTNGSNIGLNVTNPYALPEAFFRLEWP